MTYLIQHLKNLSLTLILLTVTLWPVPTQAQGGVVVRPYWTFRTEAPVSHVQTGDAFGGEGTPEVVALTDAGVVYVLQLDGAVAWRHAANIAAENLLVANLDQTDPIAEIFIAGRGEGLMLSQSQRPAWYWRRANMVEVTASGVADMDGDAEPELIVAGANIVAIDPQEGFNYDTDWETIAAGGRSGGRPVSDIWLGDLDGDAQPELLAGPTGEDGIFILKDRDFGIARQFRLSEPLGLVQAGSVFGSDEPPAFAALSESWTLFLLDHGGNVVWQRPAKLNGSAAPPAASAPGQLQVRDLDGDQQAEIIVLAPGPSPTVMVFDSAGRQRWQRPLPAVGPDDTPPHRAGAVLIDDLNADGQAELVVTAPGGARAYLLNAAGELLAEYIPQSAINAAAYADLNGDGRGEIILGTDIGVQLFGTSSEIVWQERWQSPALSATWVSAVYYGDLTGDSQNEILAGFQSGLLFTLSDSGRVMGDVDLGGSVRALDAGDTDGDGRPEIAVATAVDGGQLHLLAGQRELWRTRVGTINGVILHDLTGDDQAEILVRAGSTRGLVQLYAGVGELRWQQRFDEPVTAIGAAGASVLVGTESGRIYRLDSDGVRLSKQELGAEILAFEAGLAITVDGQIFRLEGNSPTLVRALSGPFQQVKLNPASTVVLQEGRVSLIDADGNASPVQVAGRVISLALNDVPTAGDETVIIIGDDRGRVYLYGLSLDQSPLLTQPDLTETRSGYIYSVSLNDPEGDSVDLTLEVWDPSAGAWVSYDTQVGQGQGQLSWQVAEPFDIWDSGQESRFRFHYDDGRSQGRTAETPGPLNIPTEPWYVFYGRWFGLAALVMLIPALGLVLYRRQQAYRRSPAGQAETLLGELQAKPQTALLRLHHLARTEPTQLTLLTGLARQAGNTALARLSEGFQLLAAQPNLANQGLQAILEAGTQLPSDAGAEAETLLSRYRLLRQALEANTISRIVALRPALTGEPEAELLPVSQPLANFQRVDTLADKVAYLGQALQLLGRLERDTISALPQPEQNIFSQIAATWLQVTNNALQDLQGRAQVEVSLKTRRLLKLEQATLSLELTNSGRSPASNIAVSLAPDQPFAVNNGRVQLDLLPAGRSAVVELPISAAGSVEQFRAEFLITYDDREGEGKSLAFADVVHLLRPAAEFRSLPNPYAPGTPLAPASPIFFGREDLFQFITENIAGLTRQNILVLIGQRRMGKTSFLQQLPARLGDDYLPVYIDGQSLGIDPGMANFFYDLSLAVVDALDDAGIVIDEPELAELQERPSGFFEREFLPRVFGAIGDRQLLLLFDEFEELEMRVDSGKLDPALFSFFRHLMQHDRRLGFIFVGTHRLEALSSDYWSIFFNIALYKHVTFLDETAARALITEPVADYGLIYDDLALGKMLRTTAGHPYFLQLTCHALVNRANREQRGYVTIQDVNVVLNEMVELGEAHFAFLWEQAGPHEQLVLAALTRLLNETPTVTTAQLAELLAERGVSLRLPEIIDALRSLAERDVVWELRGQPPRYEYKVELVRLWVERYKALGRVVEEVG